MKKRRPMRPGWKPAGRVASMRELFYVDGTRTGWYLVAQAMRLGQWQAHIDTGLNRILALDDGPIWNGPTEAAAQERAEYTAGVVMEILADTTRTMAAVVLEKVLRDAATVPEEAQS